MGWKQHQPAGGEEEEGEDKSGEGEERGEEVQEGRCNVLQLLLLLLLHIKWTLQTFPLPLL